MWCIGRFICIEAANKVLDVGRHIGRSMKGRLRLEVLWESSMGVRLKETSLKLC